MASRNKANGLRSLGLASPWDVLGAEPIAMQSPSKIISPEARRKPEVSCQPGQVFLRDIYSIPAMQKKLRGRPEGRGYLELLHRHNGGGPVNILARIWEKEAYPPGIEALHRLVFTSMPGWLQRLESQGGNDLSRVKLLVNLAGVNNPTFGTGRSALSAAENPEYLKLGRPIAVVEFMPRTDEAGALGL